MAVPERVPDRSWPRREGVVLALLALSSLWFFASALLRLGGTEFALRVHALRLAAFLHQLSPGGAGTAYGQALYGVMDHLLRTAVHLVTGLAGVGVMLCVARKMRDPDPFGLPLLVAGLLGALASLTTWTAAPLWSTFVLAFQGGFVVVAARNIRNAVVPLPDA